MSPTEMVGSLRRRGILVVPSGDGRLRYCPREALSAADRAVLLRHREAILALLDGDPIGWRTAVMAAQVPVTGAIPLLLARPGIRIGRGTCLSCGDLLTPDNRYRCGPCVAATVAFLDRVP
jgi:hypothetical protein